MESWNIRIYSVGVWNNSFDVGSDDFSQKLEFTPLEFETRSAYRSASLWWEN